MDITSARILELIESAFDLDAAARYVCEELVTLPRYTWVGVYWVEGEELVLRGWAGPEETDLDRIPLDQGVCGAAATSGETQIVADVREDDRYLSCFPSTRSEIVVPIKDGETVLGEIDADSDEVAAFDESDANVLRVLADALAARADPA